jgi:hypothetical protein
VCLGAAGASYPHPVLGVDRRRSPLDIPSSLPSLTPAAGYSGSITISCSGLSANASCVFSPASRASWCVPSEQAWPPSFFCCHCGGESATSREARCIDCLGGANGGFIGLGGGGPAPAPRRRQSARLPPPLHSVFALSRWRRRMAPRRRRCRSLWLLCRWFRGN